MFTEDRGQLVHHCVFIDNVFLTTEKHGMHGAKDVYQHTHSLPLWTFIHLGIGMESAFMCMKCFLRLALRFKSDYAQIWSHLPTEGELRQYSETSVIKKWIYVHSCSSAWLQQWAVEVSSIVGRLCYNRAEGEMYFKIVTVIVKRGGR